MSSQDAKRDPVLRTERMILRPVAVEDFDDLLAVWSDEGFTRHIMGHALTGEDVWFRLLRDLGHWQAVGYGNWAMRLIDGGDYVGSVGVLDYRREVEPPIDAPELGWGVASRFQGQGLAREGLEAVLAWAGSAGMTRTVAMIDAANTASIAMAERVGYRPLCEAAYIGAPVTLFERVARS